MPIFGRDWELHVIRESVQRRPSDGRQRTVGRYQIFHDGVAQTGAAMSGMTAETKGPGANKPVNNGKRIEPGRYPLLTHAPGNYSTWNYSKSLDPDAVPKPSLELGDTVARTDILVHPGHDFLASVGCINLCTSLPDAHEEITYVSSRKRVITVIENLKFSKVETIRSMSCDLSFINSRKARLFQQRLLVLWIRSERRKFSSEAACGRMRRATKASRFDFHARTANPMRAFQAETARYLQDNSRHA